MSSIATYDALGHLDRMVHCRRQADHTVTETDARRTSSQIGKEGLRRAHVRVIRERSVFDAPDGIEAHLFGEQRLLDGLLEYPVIAFPRSVRGLGFVNQRKLHCVRLHEFWTVLSRAVRPRPVDDRDGPRNGVSDRACLPASSVWINAACFVVEGFAEG
jgi:hypothetical protein